MFVYIPTQYCHYKYLRAIINQLNWAIYVPIICSIVFSMLVSPQNTFRKKLINFCGFYLQGEFNNFKLSSQERGVQKIQLGSVEGTFPIVYRQGGPFSFSEYFSK